MLAWEQELGKEYTPHHWEKSCRLIHSSTRSTNLGKMQQKILLRWYLTPHRIAKIFTGVSPDCWRDCGNTGTLIHILWFCPKLRGLWSQVERIMMDITGIKQALSPGMALLSLDLHTIPSMYRAVISHILLATRISILRKWKEINAPTLSEIIQTTQTNGSYKVLHASANGNYKKVKEQWEPMGLVLTGK